MKTHEDERYVVIKAYKFTVFEILRDWWWTPNFELTCGSSRTFCHSIFALFSCVVSQIAILLFS